MLHFSVRPFQGAGQCRHRPGVVAGLGVPTWALEGNPGGLSKCPGNAGGVEVTPARLLQAATFTECGAWDLCYKYIPFFVPGKSHLHSL